jgi:hypothetical protein
VRYPDGLGIAGWIAPGTAAEWWRAVGPGPPGSAERPLSLVRVVATAGSITSVWSWGGVITSVGMRDGVLIVERGEHERHEHARRADGWSVVLHSGDARSSIDLGGRRRVRAAARPDATSEHRVTARAPALRVRAGHAPLRFELGERAYRRSEESWDEAGRPRAVVAITATRQYLVIEASIEKSEVVLRPRGAADPALDNEHPDIHSDGAQLYVAAPEWDRPAAWLVVPEHPEPRVRTHIVDGARADVPLVAGWSSESRGYAMRFEIPLDALGAGRELPLAIDLIVNEMAAGRVRRRGQLVLSGGGGWIYLQGDRQSATRFLPVVVERD